MTLEGDRWIDVDDADVRWMVAQGFNANEVAFIAGVSPSVAAWWVGVMKARWNGAVRPEVA